MRLAEKVALVTGSGSGIGRVIARTFASEGSAVVVADRLGDKAEEVAREIEVAGHRAIATTTDVTVAADVDAMVVAAEQAFGRVDVLVNNAAVCEGDNVVAMDEETWDIDVTGVLKSAFLCCRRVVPSMAERGRGAIVNIASVNGLAYFGNEAYSAAKAGMINLTQSIAVRYGRYGVRANVIAPGSIRTPIWQERVDKEPEVFERLVKWYPLGRIGEPEDVANAALFLASDEAAWITGALLRVDGGLLAGNDLMTRDLLVESRDQDELGAYGA
jgi:meso-butanediol dehydrogenase / (S,S)-butanediol dehydrogenase / diacetyl reductase